MKKANWEIKKLSEVVDFQRGLTYSKNDEVDFSDNIVLRSNNVDLKTNSLDFDDLRYISNKIEIPESKKVTKGSIIVCTANGSKSHLGKVALIDDDYGYAFGGFMGLLKPKVTLNSNFLFYAMTSDAYKKFIGALSDGANINNLKFSDLGNFEITVPPLPEQQRIVSVLDESFTNISKAKDNAEQNLKNAKELFESYLHSIFTNKENNWEEKTLGEVCEDLFAGGDVDKNNMSRTKTDVFSIPIFTNGEKNKGLYGYTNIARVTKPSITISARGTIGYSEIREEAFYPAVRLIVVIPRLDVIILPFLKYVISGMGFIHSGSSIPQLTVPMVKDYPVNLPPLEQQQVIVKKLDELSNETKKLEAIYEKKLKDLEELKKSILQKAFNGEL
ncbi:restriction endonuclease subunit S [Candidatus Gracilibacteria bacterium]|nr:restriction endonuclease subunit S [Candidatus Gracilibacteria bacterium]